MLIAQNGAYPPSGSRLPLYELPGHLHAIPTLRAELVQVFEETVVGINSAETWLALERWPTTIRVGLRPNGDPALHQPNSKPRHGEDRIWGHLLRLARSQAIK
jgi:hypothetical protein